MSHFLFIHSSIDGPLGCFHLSVNIGVQVFVHVFLFLLCIYLGMELLGHMITLFNCLTNCKTLFLSGYLENVTFSFPACSVLGF